VALTTIVVELYEPEAILGRGSRDPIRGAFRDSLQVLTTSVAGLVRILVPDTVASCGRVRHLGRAGDPRQRQAGRKGRGARQSHGQLRLL
jgi:hypothetical protein